MKEIKAIIQRFMLDKVIDSLHELPHLPGITMSMVWGFVRNDPSGRPSMLADEAKMAKIELVVSDDLAETVIETIATAAKTGLGSDGKIFVSEVADVIIISSGKRGEKSI
jgi:nitrogen regulatory protein P-II 1